MNTEYIKHTEGDAMNGVVTIYVAFRESDMLTVKHTAYVSGDMYAIETSEGYKGGYQPYIAGNTTEIDAAEFGQAYSASLIAVTNSARKMRQYGKGA